MPIYEFQCEMCGKKFERISKDKTLQAIHCPECEKDGKDNLAFKIISRTNFKVNGFNADNGYSKS
jgi:putative FmdB family regulatory protein